MKLKRVFFLLFFLITANLTSGYRLMGLRLPTKIFSKKYINKRFYSKKFRSFFPQLSYFYRIRNWIELYVIQFQQKRIQKLQQPQHVIEKKLYIDNIDLTIDLSVSYEFISNQLQEYSTRYENYDWKKVLVKFSYNNKDIQWVVEKTKQGRSLKEAFDLLSEFIKYNRIQLRMLTKVTEENETNETALLGLKTIEGFLNCFNKKE